MSDAWLAGDFGALCVVAIAWWLVFRTIVRRLTGRHTARAAAILGTPERRKNGMDRFFAVIGFLFQSQSDLRDVPLLLACAGLKALTLLWLLVFAAMMFTPMFLQLGAERG